VRAHLKVRADTTVIPSAVGVRAVKLDDSCPGPGCVDRRLQFLLASIAGAGNVENPLQYVRTRARKSSPHSRWQSSSVSDDRRACYQRKKPLAWIVKSKPAGQSIDGVDSPCLGSCALDIGLARYRVGWCEQTTVCAVLQLGAPSGDWFGGELAGPPRA